MTVTNVDEAGSVTLDDLQPQAGRTVGECEPVGPGRRCTRRLRGSGRSRWTRPSGTDIGGATSATYCAWQETMIGYYLRATATYSDGLGDWA